MARRLTKEAQELAENPLDWGSAEPNEGDLFAWTASVEGPAGTPYEEGLFSLRIDVPSEYPFRPPNVEFTTKIYHPNVKSDTGAICADILKEKWKPTLNMRWVLGVIKSMLEEPSPESALEAEIGAQIRNDPDAFARTAKEWTKKYAC